MLRRTEQISRHHHQQQKQEYDNVKRKLEMGETGLAKMNNINVSYCVYVMVGLYRRLVEVSQTQVYSQFRGL